MTVSTLSLTAAPLPVGWKYMNPEATNQKTELLEMIEVVRDSLSKAWTINPKGKKKKLDQLDALHKRVMGVHDDRLETIMVNSAMQSSTCCGPLRGFGGMGIRGGRVGSYQAVAKNHVSTAMKFLDVYTSSLRSDCGTIGGDEMRYSIEFDGFNSCYKLDEFGSFVSDDDGDAWAKDMLDSLVGVSTGYSSDDLLSTGTETDSFNSSIDGLSVTTSSFTSSDDGEDLGISITTWSSVKMDEKKVATSPTSKSKREQFAQRCEKSLQDHDSDKTSSTTGSTQGDLDEVGDLVGDDGNDEDMNLRGDVQEVAVSIGDITIRATRKKVVRFCGVKPTMEENLSRARDLLASYNHLSQMWNKEDK